MEKSYETAMEFVDRLKVDIRLSHFSYNLSQLSL